MPDAPPAPTAHAPALPTAADRDRGPRGYGREETVESEALLTTVSRERAMRLLARTGLLAGMLEGLIADQLRAESECAALQARVRQLEARAADPAPGPLLSAGAFSRIQRAQQARDDLRADLRRLRERYADAPDPD